MTRQIFINCSIIRNNSRTIHSCWKHRMNVMTSNGIKNVDKKFHSSNCDWCWVSNLGSPRKMFIKVVYEYIKNVTHATVHRRGRLEREWKKTGAVLWTWAKPISNASALSFAINAIAKITEDPSNTPKVSYTRYRHAVRLRRHTITGNHSGRP